MAEFELKINDTTKGLPADLKTKLAQILGEMERSESSELSKKLSPPDQILWYVAYKTAI